MDLETARACITNALLIALADRQFHPLQRRLLQRFVAEAGVPLDKARAWAEDVQGGAIDFLPVRDAVAAEAVLKLSIGVAAVNGQLAQEERAALLSLAKAVGVTRPRLGELLQEVWGKDVIGELFPPVSPPSSDTLLVTDYFQALERVLSACQDVPLDARPLSELRPIGTPVAVVFHAASETDATLAHFERIRRLAPRGTWIGVIDRHQAPQVSHLLDAGARRCLVEELYPGELGALLNELQTQDRAAS